MPKTKNHILVLLIVLVSFTTFGQSSTSRWKAQLALGFSSPNSNRFVSGFEAQSINFPTVNIGVQHMLTETMGAKLDYGFNRITSTSNSIDFKLNYSRVNAQFVYDATPVLTFLPTRLSLVGHAGPGLTFIKPLGNFSDNKHSFFNTMVGAEIHYSITERLSIYTDISYIFSFASDKTYNPVSDGYGTFNGDLLTITFGLSFSLSGCQYCD